ncbi:MAG: FAD-dependent monooxygenase [Deltaproteobacteria bacterium]|nr:FAD-dependent monooxygenase [Deltaproteobacteria bacterium]
MRIVSVGGGPAGLYFGILARKVDPSMEVTIYERNRPDDTFGWGVVFSDETLGNFQRADGESFAQIESSFIHWNDIHVLHRGQRMISQGHGFSGLARVRLLNILHARARALGVKLVFEHEVKDPRKELDADLVLLADGANSRMRTLYEEQFRPTVNLRKCRFSWLGLDRPMTAFTFIFKDSPHGMFTVHAYPFSATQSTFIVECREETWRAAGLEHATEEQTVAFAEHLFQDEIRGHHIIPNRSIWRAFPNVRADRWHHDNMVLLGDAAHTAHFSIGSGTKLAMEDAVALWSQLVMHRHSGIPAVLAAYEAARRPEVERLQKAAQTSLEWFENVDRYKDQELLPFTFNLMTRSKRITYDNLAQRDPRLVEETAAHLQERVTGARPAGKAKPPAFQPYTLRALTLPNRIVVSPMCQYSATDGTPEDWHLVHLGSRAVGGAGLIITEATGVSAEGRISPGCTGMYREEHVAAWKRVVDFVHHHSPAKIGLQLGHAGRKASSARPWDGGGPLTPAHGGWLTHAPSALPYDAGWPVPRALDRHAMDKVIADFTAATRRAATAGFDLVELHMAHGYLLSTFLSPLTNTRTDPYGGDVKGRLRFPLEVLDAARAVWPTDRPLSVRISATDWAEGGTSDADLREIARALRAHGADIVDCSAGGVVPHQQPVYGRMFQVHLADFVRNDAGVPSMTVGNLQDADQCNTIIAAGRADLTVLARAHLTDPYLAQRAAARYGVEDFAWPRQYLRARPAS